MGIRDWWRRRDLDDQDLQDEIRAHLAIAAGERLADGDDEREARYAALREFGNVTRMREETRRVWTPRWLELLLDLTSDARYAARTLVKNKGFSLAVIAVLTLGIGLNAAVFTMLKGLTVKPLSGVSGAGRLVTVYARTSAGRPVRLSYPDFQHFREHATTFKGVYGSTVAAMSLGRGRDARQIWGEIVTGNYFDVLGVPAQHGRTLRAGDETAPGGNPVVVISDSLWRRSFDRDPNLVGRTIEINNTALTVVGILPEAFKGSMVVYDVEAFVPITMGPVLGFYFSSEQRTAAAMLADPRARVFFAQGYIRDDETLESAQAQADALWSTVSRDRAPEETPERLRVVPFISTPGSAPETVVPLLAVLTVMGLFVLAIACANVAGLVLVRGVSRRGEIALRLALGGSRARIVRLMLVENIVLAIPGVVLGIALAFRLLPIFFDYAQALAAPQMLYFNFGLDGYTVAYSVLATCGSVLIFGFMPALQSSRVDLVSVINQDASPRGAARGRMRAGLVVAQIAVSLPLLVAAGLTGRSVSEARRAYPGFDAAGVTSVTLDVKQNGYDPAGGAQFYRRLLQKARDGAGIETAALAAYNPLNFTDTRVLPILIEGYAAERDEDLNVATNTVSSNYFRALRVPMAAGREFTDRDDETGEPVIIVNHTFAARFLGGDRQAIGRRVRVGDGPMRTVVGVAADLKYLRINESPRPYFYLPFFQAYRPQAILHTRGSAPLEALVAQARADVDAIDPQMPVVAAGPLAQRLEGALIFMNLAAATLLLFGAAGMLLAGLGTYGLIAYTVKQRTREIGIRMALGAPARSIVRAFLTGGLKLGIAGAALGLAAALAIAPMLRTFLFGVSPTDMMSFASALAGIFAGILLATVVPSWRAARINPLTALRHQ